MHILIEAFLIIAVIITFGLSSYMWRRRSLAGALPFFVMLLADGFWSLIYWAALEFYDLPTKLFLTDLSYIGILAIYPAALILILQYIHNVRWLAFPRIGLLFIEPVLTLAFIWTNPLHHLFWTSINIDTAGSYSALILQPGPVYWVHALAANLLLILAASLLIRQLTHADRLYRGQIISLLAGALVPWLVNLLFTFGVTPLPNINLTYIVFAFTSPFLAWGLFRYQVQNLETTAYDTLIENMQDGVILLDQVNRVVTLNPAAEKITGQSRVGFAGLPSDLFFASWPAMTDFIKSGDMSMTDVRLDSKEPEQYFDLNATDLSDEQGRKNGRFIVMRDISRSKKIEASQARRAEELSRLHTALLDIAASRDLDTLLATVVERAMHLFGAAAGALYICDQASRQVRCVVSRNHPHSHPGKTFAYGQGEAGIIAQNGLPLKIDDYPVWTEQIPSPYQEKSTHALMGVPLIWQGQVTGVLTVADEDPTRCFTSNDLELLTMFADQVAIAIENARLYQEAREAAGRSAILHQASQEVVVASLDPERIYTTIHQAAARLMASEAFAITLMNETTHMIDAVYLVDHKGRSPSVSIPAHRGLSGHVINTGKSLYIEDMLEKLDTIDSIRYGDKEEVRSILSVPMRLGDKVIGMLSTQSYLPNAYIPEDIHLLEMLASYAAIALDNARLFGEVQKLAITDALTGAYNRRQLFELGQREFNRAHRFDRPFSVILLDIDQFKVVNDTYGHATGDLVLRVMTQRIQETIREIDILARYGGEEFVVLLPETTCTAALSAAERLRNLAGHQPIPTEHGDVVVTVSIGVTEIRPETQDFTALVVRADEAMYDAKKAGRDRIGVR